MKQTLVLLLVWLATATAHADSADLRLSVDNDTRVVAGSRLYLNTFLVNLGPDTARNVVVTMQLDGLNGVILPCLNGTCALGDLKKYDSPSPPQLIIDLPPVDLTLTFTVSVTSDTPDPNPQNNVVARKVVVTTAPNLHPYLNLPVLIDPGLPFAGLLYVYNDGYSTAHNVVTTIDLPPGVTVASLPRECSATATRLSCTGATLNRYEVYYALTFVAPPRYEGGELAFNVVSQASEKNFYDEPAQRINTTTMYQTFLVTNTSDEGQGSLRSAIEASTVCKYPLQCAIQFNITEASEHPWKTIRPRSPLPRLNAAYPVRIDGATQSAFSGVANPGGPPIEISGGGVVNGEGLLTEGPVTIANLTINGFLRNGLALANPSGSSIHDNFIGTDPTGSIAIPNNRGIGISQSQPYLLSLTHIYGNVLSGNVHSGLFALGGDLNLSENRIGLKAHSDQPLPNGASGVYFDRVCGRIEASGNIIAFNREMGVAIHPDLLYIKLSGNRIWGNGRLAIDDGLDGPSVAVRAENGSLSVPVITSASFDPMTGTTTIRGSAPGADSALEIFASDAPGPLGSGDAQRLVYSNPTITIDSFDFPVTVRGDLRGQWVAAMSSRIFYGPVPDVFNLFRSTELSKAVQVH